MKSRKLVQVSRGLCYLTDLVLSELEREVEDRLNSGRFGENPYTSPVQSSKVPRIPPPPTQGQKSPITNHQTQNVIDGEVPALNIEPIAPVQTQLLSSPKPETQITPAVKVACWIVTTKS